MKRPVLVAAVLAAVHSAVAADLSVTAITDFLSDVKASIAARDKDGDGQLNKDELADRAWMLFAFDADRDGKLTEEEMKRGLSKMSRNIFASKANAPSTELAPMIEIPNDPVRSPKAVRGTDLGVGVLIPNVTSLTTLDDKPVSLSDVAGPKGTVLAMISTSCPLSKKYAPVLARLEKEYAARGIKFVGLAAPGEDDVAALKAFGLAGPILRPANTGRLLRALGASHTTDVFVLDAARTLVYRGAVDDQYGLGYNRDSAREHFLTVALESMLAGMRPAVAATIAPGCELELPQVSAPPENSPPTWHNRISRIVQTNCAICHRDGGVGPFPFETYEQFGKKAGTIKRVVTEDVMPPWFAPAPAGRTHSLWLNDVSLTPHDKADLLAWLAAGRPEGDTRDAALPLAWPEGWMIGQPDLIFQIPAPIAVKAEGTMPYQSIMVETKLTEDKWVTAWELRPTAREVVHHILTFIYKPGELTFPGSEEKRGHLASFAPGHSAAIYPDGYAKLLPKGTTLRFEIHYTPNGKATQDQTMLGLRFAPKPPDHIVEVAGIANVQIAIPPGAPAHPEAAVFKLPSDARILSLTPHMHMRGKAMRFEVLTPEGTTARTLLDMPRFDFNWQIPTRYAEPPLVRAGSLLRVTGWFDNSSANPNNPDPTATVRWGSQTADEMMIGYVEYSREK
jgi:thiol-disulfide isomerase/thioredoxin